MVPKLYRLADLPLGPAPLPQLPCARGHIDSLRAQPDGTFQVRAWMVLPESPLDQVQAFVDGNLIHTSPLTPRPDVARVLRQRFPRRLAKHLWLAPRLGRGDAWELLRSLSLPWVPHAQLCGIDLTLPSNSFLHAPTTRLDLIGSFQGQPLARLGQLFRHDLAAFPDADPDLMYRATHIRSALAFKLTGLKTFGEFLQPLARHTDLAALRRVLDWGCGCGRITMFFLAAQDGPQVCGADIDPEAVAWANAHLCAGAFQTLAPRPPTPYPDQHFDLITAYSVLTHLQRDTQEAWLAEMARILEPGGFFLATVHGPFAQQWSMNSRCAVFPPSGILDACRDASLGRLAPRGYYRGTYQSKQYTLRVFARHFRILDYIERGANNLQDLVILQKP